MSTPASFCSVAVIVWVGALCFQYKHCSLFMISEHKMLCLTSLELQGWAMVYFLFTGILVVHKGALNMQGKIILSFRVRSSWSALLSIHPYSRVKYCFVVPDKAYLVQHTSQASRKPTGTRWSQKLATGSPVDHNLLIWNKVHLQGDSLPECERRISLVCTLHWSSFGSRKGNLLIFRTPIWYHVEENITELKNSCLNTMKLLGILFRNLTVCSWTARFESSCYNPRCTWQSQ